jgi:hypothetical protein
LMYCFISMKGAEMPARAQGNEESILLALQEMVSFTRAGVDWDGCGCVYRAISIAPADQGLVKRTEGFGAAGLPGSRLEGEPCSRDGERIGEEKESR